MSCVVCKIFFGSPECDDMCSTCYRKANPEGAAIAEAKAREKEAFSSSWEAAAKLGDIPRLSQMFSGDSPYQRDMMDALLQQSFLNFCRKYNLQLVQQQCLGNDLLGHNYKDVPHCFVNINS